MAIQQGFHLLINLGIIKLACGQIDGNHKLVINQGPEPFQIVAGRLCNDPAKLFKQACFLSQGDNQRRVKKSCHRVLPSEQCLCADHPALRVNLGLIIKVDTAISDIPPQLTDKALGHCRQSACASQ